MELELESSLRLAKRVHKTPVVPFDYFQPVLFNLSWRSGVNVHEVGVTTRVFQFKGMF